MRHILSGRDISLIWAVNCVMYKAAFPQSNPCSSIGVNASCLHEQTIDPVIIREETILESTCRSA
jgi:hypothetical protein